MVNTNKKIRYQRLAVAKLTDIQKNQMFQLFEQYYVDVNREQFEVDLCEKNHVLTLFDLKNNIIGFSTIFKKQMSTTDGFSFLALFSGDTVIHQDYWGTKSLQKAFFWYIVESKVLAYKQPLIWFLQSKGHKTYLMMRKNFQKSYPNDFSPTPTHLEAAMNFFYLKKYGDDFKVDEGLIRFKNSKGAVKGGMAKPKEEHLKDRDVQYFLRRNPDYGLGHELACVCEIEFSDFLGHISKYFIRF